MEHMGPYWVLSVLVGVYRSLCIPMDTNGSLSVLIGLSGYLWLPIDPYASLKVFMGPYRSLCSLMGSVLVLLRLYRFQ